MENAWLSWPMIRCWALRAVQNQAFLIGLKEGSIQMGNDFFKMETQVSMDGIGLSLTIYSES